MGRHSLPEKLSQLGFLLGLPMRHPLRQQVYKSRFVEVAARLLMRVSLLRLNFHGFRLLALDLLNARVSGLSFDQP